MPVGVGGGSGDSADPKKILADLQQLAAVCQRLGIDLAKVSAMGQTVSSGGKGPGNLGEQHAAQMPGGGTGYTNMANGSLASITSSKIALQNVSNKGPLSRNFGRMRGSGTIADSNFAEHLKETFAPYENIDKMKYVPWLDIGKNVGYNQPWGDETVHYSNLEGKRRNREFMRSLAPGREMRRIAKAQRTGIRNMFQDKMNRRLFAFHMLQGVGGDIYNAISEPIDEASGETMSYRVVSTIGAQVSKAGHIASTIAWAEAAFAASRNMRLAGKALWAGRLGKAAMFGIRAAKYAGPQALIAATIDVGLAVGGEVMERWQDENDALMKAAKFRRSMRGELHSQWTQKKDDDNPAGYIYTTKTKPLDPKMVAKFEASVEDGRNEFYIDSYGRKVRRNAFSRLIRTLDKNDYGLGWAFYPAFKAWANWGVSEERKKEREARIEEAGKRHTAAVQKAQVMDWEGAKREVAKAREAIVSEEMMPFFWKQPEVYLRQMEASRIAGRNWARAQQPRGGSRTGD